MSELPQQHIKQVTLTGPAALDVTGGKKERKKRSTSGGSSVQPSSAPSTLSSAPVTSSPRIPLPLSTPISSTIKPQLTGGNTTTTNSSPLLNGHTVPTTPSSPESNNKVIKVELKKNNQTKRVQLQPKKTPNSPLKGGKRPSTSQTKKSRKVTLGVVSLHKRMSRAKKMTRKVKEMPYQQLREHLIQKKLIKPTSKAPESVLRQIAADAQIVAGKAL